MIVGFARWQVDLRSKITKMGVFPGISTLSWKQWMCLRSRIVWELAAMGKRYRHDMVSWHCAIMHPPQAEKAAAYPFRESFPTV